MSKQSKKKRNNQPLSKEELLLMVQTGEIWMLLLTRPTDGQEIVWANRCDGQPLSKPFVTAFRKIEQELFSMLTISDIRLCTDRTGHLTGFIGDPDNKAYHLNEEFHLMCCRACAEIRRLARAKVEADPTFQMLYTPTEP